MKEPEREHDELEEPGMDPECTQATDDEEMECEFEVRDGCWWCNTHNCYA